MPVPPTPWGCLEDQLRAHIEGLGLEKSPVQIIGLEGLFLPPVAASRPEGGPEAKLWVVYPGEGKAVPLVALQGCWSI